MPKHTDSLSYTPPPDRPTSTPLVLLLHPPPLAQSPATLGLDKLHKILLLLTHRFSYRREPWLNCSLLRSDHSTGQSDENSEWEDDTRKSTWSRVMHFFFSFNVWQNRQANFLFQWMLQRATRVKEHSRRQRHHGNTRRLPITYSLCKWGSTGHHCQLTICLRQGSWPYCLPVI